MRYLLFFAAALAFAQTDPITRSTGTKTAGKQLAFDANGKVVASAYDVTSGGTAGTINSGSGQGFWFPWGQTSSSATGATVSGLGAGRGVRYQMLVPAQMEFRSLNIYISTASGTCAAVCGLQFGLYNYAMTSLVAATTTATSDSNPNINATGAAKLVWGSGSAVTGGVLTLPAGVYWLVAGTDSTSLALSVYGSATGISIVNATTTTNQSYGTLLTAYAASTVINGTTGASVALDADISAKTFTSNNSGHIVVALVN